MRFDLDDPRLTAYALGEIEDDSERAALEAQLAEDEASRRVVDEVREAARLLADGLKAEAGPELAEGHRRAIASLLAPRSRVPWYAYGLAASLLIATGVLALQAMRPDAPRRLAQAGPAHARTTAVAPAAAPPRLWHSSDGSVVADGEPAKLALNDLADRQDHLSLQRGEALGEKLVDEYSFDVPAEGAALADRPRILSSESAPPTAFFRESARKPTSAMDLSTVVPPATPLPEATVEQLQSRQSGGRADQPDKSPQDGLATTRAVQEPLLQQVPAAGDRFARGLAAAAPASGPVAAVESRMRAGGMAGGMGAMAGEKKLHDGAAAGSQHVDGRMGDVSRGTRLGRVAQPARPGAAATAPAPVAAKLDSRANRGFGLAEAAGSQPAQPPPAQNMPGLVASLPAEEKQVRLQAELLKREEVLRKKVKDVKEAEVVALGVQEAEGNREGFNPIVENDFIKVLEEPRSTFSIDVDTASYAIVRRYLMDQSIFPPRDAVRIEELVNYFRYDYPQPKGDDPFSVNMEIARCPWNADHRLARIGLKGRELDQAKRGPSNLVFLVDVSGSMNSPDKLPLLQTGLRMLVDELGENDRVAIVVYAGGEGLALDSTTGDRKAEILRVIDAMRPGGSTHASAGIQLAYQIAAKHFIPGGVNRVILATDGDFNVGVTDDGALQTLIAEKAKSKVFLTVLGVGRGNLQDAKMEGLADKGNGNYHYLDTPKEAHKVLVEEMGGNLVTIAKDVKIQVDFNPARVGAYRLLGYENRKLANQDFRDDTKDAGEIGAGHTVTALYELVPPGKGTELAEADRPAFVKPAEAAKPDAKESFIVRLRFKKPEEDKSVEREYPVQDEGRDYAQATDDYKFAAAVTSFGLVLRDSKYKGTASLDATLELAEASKGSDPGGYRAEFLEIIRKAKALGPR